MLIAVVDKLVVILFLFLTFNALIVSSTSDSIEETILEGKRFLVQQIFYTKLLQSNLKTVTCLSADFVI